MKPKKRPSKHDHQKRINVWIDLSVYSRLSDRCADSEEFMNKEVQRALMQYLGMPEMGTGKLQ